MKLTKTNPDPNQTLPRRGNTKVDLVSTVCSNMDRHHPRSIMAVIRDLLSDHLETGGATETDEFSEKFQNGGDIIFNPKN